MRKSTWQAADVRRPLVSASHIIQAGNDLFIGKDEAYTMNRKRKEKSMLRKQGNVYVLDLFVRVPSSVAAPIVYTPMEVGAINQVTDGREARRRVKFDCNSPTFLTSGVVSVEDRSKRAETVRFDDGSAQVRNMPDPGQPNANEHQEHMTTHRPYRSCCKFSVMGRGVNAPHRRSDAQDDLEGVPHVSVDCGFIGEKESEDRVSLVLVIQERRKGTEFP